MKKLMIGLMGLLFINLAFAASSETDVKNAYLAWCQAIGTAKGKPDVVVKYYAPDALLLPTLSAKILVNKDGGLNDYFAKLTSYPNIKCVPETLITKMYGDMAVNSGLYDFVYTDHNKPVTVHARFTFVYKDQDNQWLIVNHHSSKLP